MSLLLCAVILFSQCKKDATEETFADLTPSAVMATTSSTTVVSGTLNVSNAVSDGGYAYYIGQDLQTPGDSNNGSTVSTIRIFENGKEIGPAHSLHNDIRKNGAGRFSHWNSGLYFSASDNTNPKTNGRTYTYTNSTTATTTTTTTTPTTTSSGVVLDLSRAGSDGGFAYYIDVDPNIVGDSNEQLTISKMRLFENGVEIGPAHAVHADIRNYGKGRFSHWGTGLRFSASDNSNPKTNGKTYTYTVDGTSPTSTTTSPTTETTSPTTTETTTSPTNTSGLIGFAAANGGTKGGEGGQTVTVSSLSALQSALSSTSPMIINISGTISGSSMLDVKSNKTVNGLSGATLNGVGLSIWNNSNVIIRNIRIQNSPIDAITIRDNAHHVWIDHCWLDRASDELVDISRGGDFVTVSWTKFTGTNYGVLIGGGAVESMNSGKLNVTLHHNYFYDIAERVPFASTGIVHFFNNYVHHQNVPYNEPQVDAWNQVNIRVENNYFKNIANRTIRALTQYGSGKILNLNNTMDNCPNPLYVETAPSTWAPSYEYKSALHSSTDVPSAILNGVGPR